MKDVNELIKSLPKIEGVTIGPLLKKDPSISEEEWEKQVKDHREKFLSNMGLKLVDKEIKDGQ